MILKTYGQPTQALEAMSLHLDRIIREKPGKPFHLALSGGETAKKMFTLWKEAFQTKIDWPNIRFYWADERCVPKYDEESNFGHANRMLFFPLGIPKEHYHRIKGENYPPAEAERYSHRIEELLPSHNGLPRFDCIILGVGDDLHTASIFPSTPELLTSEQLYAVSNHPETGRQRITVTGPLILNDTPLLIPLLGKEKQPVAEKLKAGYQKDSPTPATYILSKAKDAIIFAG